MGLTGAAFGAANSLEEILKDQMVRAQLEQQAKQQAAQQAMEQTRLNETLRQNDITNKRQSAMDDRMAAQDREKNNIKGIRRMIGESLVQRGSAPMGPADRRDIAALQVEAGDLPDMSLLTEPKPQRQVVTTIGKRGEPIKKSVTEDELLAGVPEYREPKTGPQAEFEWIVRGNQPMQIRKGTAQAGDRPYEKPTAATGGSAVNPQEAAETAQEVKRVAGLLKNHAGFNGAFGLMNSQVPTIRQDTADAESLRDKLTSLLTLENMGKMKGVLSDSDMKIIRQASTSLNARMSPKAAADELERLTQVMDRVGSGMPAINLETSHDAGAADQIDALIAKYRKKP